MKNRRTLLSLATAVFISLQLFSQTTYQKLLGGFADEKNVYCFHAMDGNILIAGHTTSDTTRGGAGGEDIFVIKTDTMMNVIWSKTYGGAGDDFLVDRFPVAQIASPYFPLYDGGFFLVGYTFSYGQGSSDIYLLRIDKDGNLVGSKTYGTTAAERGFTIARYPDGSLVIGGDIANGPFGGTDVYMVQTDSLGNMFNNQYLGQTGNDNLFYAQATNFSSEPPFTFEFGLVYSGATASAGAGGSDAHIMKFDATGTPVWSKIYGGSADESYNSVVELSIGQGFIAAGYTQSYGAGSEDFLVSRISPNGTLIWTKTFGGMGSDIADHVIQTSDGGFAVIGTTQSFGAGGTDIMLVKMDVNGDLQWTKVYGGTGEDMSRSVDELHSGGYHICGSTESFSNNAGPGLGAYDVFTIRTDANGSSGCNDASVTSTTTSPVLTEANFLPNFTAASGLEAIAGTQPNTFSFQQQVLCQSISTPCNITANAGSDISICNGESTNLTASGGSDYSWSPAAGLNDASIANPVANPSITTTYTVTVSTSANCSQTATVTVTVNPLPTVIAIASADTIFEGNTVTLTGSGAQSYAWTGGVIDGVAFTPPSTSTYTVTGTDSYGCSNSSTATVTIISNGGDCTSAILLPIYNSLINDSQTEDEKWYSFIATNSTAKIFVHNKSNINNGRIGSVKLYSGSCNNLQLISEAVLAQDTFIQRIVGDSLLLFSDKLILGQTFYLKMQKELSNSIPAVFDVQIGDFPPSSILSCAYGFNDFCRPEGSFTTFSGPGFGYFAYGTFFFILQQTSGNLNISNFQVHASLCDNNMYVVASNNNNNHPLACCQGFVNIKFSGIIPPNSEGQQYCFDLYLYDNYTQSQVCKIPICITSSYIHPLASNSNSVCSGQCKPLIATGSATGGSYIWTTGSTGSTTIVATSASFNACPAINTTYTVSLSKPASCVIPSESVAITVYPSFNLTLSPPTGAICNGQSITINSSINPVQSGNTYTYNWSDGSTTQNLTIVPANIATYTLTVTDNNGCSATSAVTINPAGAISLNPSTSPVCANPSVAITASGASTYTWSGVGLNTTTGATVIATPTIPTTYTVTSTSSGCSTTITVNPAPNTAFTVNRFDNCEGKAVAFSHLPALGVTYTWDFGDGTPLVTGAAANAANINHTFTPSGYYLVTLKATSVPCPVQSSSQIVYITPSSTTPPYNPNCCISGYAGYDFVDLVFDPSQLNADWNGVNYKIKGTITIKAGMVFNINNSIISFGPQGQVIVEPTAILRLNGTTLTSIDYGSVCSSASMRMMWQGVEVWGNNNDGNLSAQGQLIMSNSTIEDAYNGVTLGKSLFTIGSVNPTDGVVFRYNSHDPNMGGGVLRASTGSNTFNRNGIGVRVWEFKYNTFNQLFNCNFYCKTGGVNSNVLDPHYNRNFITNMNNSTKYKAHNPQQIIFLSNGQSVAGLYVNGVKKVLMRNNVFDNAFAGIFSFTSRHDIPSSVGSPNLFKNLQYGVFISSAISGINPRNILGNTFSNADVGVVDNGGVYDNIKKNIFGLISETQFSLSGNRKVGVSTSSAQSFNIVDNTFNNLSYGIQCNNSQTNSLIGYENFGNSFVGCRYGLSASGDNFLLNVLCNSHENQISASYYDPSSTTSNFNGRIWSLTGKLKNQGNPPGTVTGSPSAKDPAGNIFNFSNKLASRKDIFANTSPATFNYYYHNDVDAFTRPDVIKQYGSGTGQNGLNSNYIRLSDNVPFANIQTACAPVVSPDCNPSCKLNVINTTATQIVQLTTEFNAVKVTLDHGNTQLLLNSIGPVGNNFKVSGGGSSSPGQLKDLLLANSLLSDTVIMAVINKVDPLPPGIFQDIIIPNSPVSDYILPHLINKLATLPPGIEKKIFDAQTSSHVRTLSVIARQIEYTQKTRQLMLNSLVSHYASADSMPQAIALLEAEHTQEANKILVAEYLAEGNLSAAQSKLNILTTIDPADAAYFNLYNLYLNLAMHNKTVWQMDSSQHAFVKQLAQTCPSTLAVINARSLLTFVYGETVAPCQGVNANAKMSSPEVINANITIEEDKMYLGNNIPNPFNDHTLIPYYMPAEAEKGLIKIFSVEGKLVKSYEIKQTENMIEVSLDEMEGGVYFYSLEVSGTIIQTRKMILIK